MNTKAKEELRLHRTLKDGRVEGLHIWPTGWQVLVFANMESFNRAKAKIETEMPPQV